MNKPYFSLLAFLLLVVAASLTASGFEAGDWYYNIIKRPALAPPGWLYSVIWALAYVLMAIAAWNIWLTGHPARLGALTWWVLLLVLNIAWTVVFFSWQRPGWALPLIGLTAGAAIFCIRAFWPLSRPAAWLLTPYLVWILFLAALDFSTWMLNGGFLSRLIS